MQGGAGSRGEECRIALHLAGIDFDDMLTLMGKRTGQKVDADRSRIEAKATRKTSERALKKLTHEVDGKLRFISDPPIITPIEEIAGGALGGESARTACAGSNAARKGSAGSGARAPGRGARTGGCGEGSGQGGAGRDRSRGA